MKRRLEWVATLAILAGSCGGNGDEIKDQSALALQNSEPAQRCKRFPPGPRRARCLWTVLHENGCHGDASLPPDGGVVDGGSGGGGLGGGGVCAASSDDVWSSMPGSGGGLKAIGRNLVLTTSGGKLNRWDGAGWVPFSPQPPFAIRDEQGTAADDIWVTSDLGAVAHFDGITWTDRSAPVPAGGWITLLAASGPRDAWLESRSPLVTPDGIIHSLAALLHWDGTAWTPVQLPVPSMLDLWFDVTWSLSSQDVRFVVRGARTPGPFILRWNGARWDREQPAAWGAGVLVFGMWGSSVNDIWAAGQDVNTATLWHFDGRAWVTRPEAGPGSFTSIWGACATDVWAVGASLTSNAEGLSSLWHYDGRSWQTTSLRGWAVTGTGPDDVWLMSATGQDPISHRSETLLWHYAPDTCGNGTVGRNEECDPPRQEAAGLQCDSRCHLLTCGNGVIDPGEQCDPPSTTGLLCDQACHVPLCGNGIVGAGESCDPPNGTTCDAACHTIPVVCGDGIVQPGESCEFPQGTLCQECRHTSCGLCFRTCGFPGSTCGGSVCEGLSAADTRSCQALVGCIAPGLAACMFSNGGLFSCYCRDLSCSQGGNGLCASQTEALAHSTDPVEVRRQIEDPSTAVGRVFAVMGNFYHSSCGQVCSGF